MILLDGVSKAYGSFTALRLIDLSIGKGEFIAVLGPSGCGKTTLLKLLAGFMKPTNGSITMDGEVVASRTTIVPPERRNIGMVFQSFALWPHMTVYDHIRFPLLYHPYSPCKEKWEMEERIKTVLEIVGLQEMAKRYPHELSGGQKQRVALARAIAPEPGLLLMDEPLSALDAELRMEMRKEIQHIHRHTKASIVYVTHDQNEALAMADRIVVMNNGKIEQTAAPEVIYTKPNTEFVATFVGKCNLVPGIWEGERFIPKHFPHEQWLDAGVSVEFKRKGLYPVRPESWILSEAQQGTPYGTVSFVQYQGKEIHYTVQVEDQEWTVYAPIHAASQFHVGDRVALSLQMPIKEKEAVYL